MLPQALPALDEGDSSCVVSLELVAGTERVLPAMLALAACAGSRTAAGALGAVAASGREEWTEDARVDGGGAVGALGSP